MPGHSQAVSRFQAEGFSCWGLAARRNKRVRATTPQPHIRASMRRSNQRSSIAITAAQSSTAIKLQNSTNNQSNDVNVPASSVACALATDSISSPRPSQLAPYQLSDDPLVRRSQLLLAASRRLRGEQPFPSPIDGFKNNIDGSTSPLPATSTPATATTPASLASAPSVRKASTAVSPQISELPYSSQQPLPLPPTPSNHITTSPTTSAADVAANATTIAVQHSTATTAATPGLPLASAAAAAAAAASVTAASVTAASAAASSSGIVFESAAGASAAVPAAVSTAAAAATAAATSAVSAAASGWQAIEELLAEAAYSLSQEIPDGLFGGGSGGFVFPSAAVPDTLIPAAATAAATAAAETATDSNAAVATETALVAAMPALSGNSLPSIVALQPPSFMPSGPAGTTTGTLLGTGSGNIPGDLGFGSLGFGSGGPGPMGLPGTERLEQMLDELLYSLSQDINLAAAADAVAVAATEAASATSSAAAGLAGAAADLPRTFLSAAYRTTRKTEPTATSTFPAPSTGAVGGGGVGGSGLDGGGSIEPSLYGSGGGGDGFVSAVTSPPPMATTPTVSFDSTTVKAAADRTSMPLAAPLDAAVVEPSVDSALGAAADAVNAAAGVSTAAADVPAAAVSTAATTAAAAAAAVPLLPDDEARFERLAAALQKLRKMREGLDPNSSTAATAAVRNPRGTPAAADNAFSSSAAADDAVSAAAVGDVAFDGTTAAAVSTIGPPVLPPSAADVTTVADAAAAAGNVNSADFGSLLPPAADVEAAASALSEALRRELGVVMASVAATDAATGAANGDGPLGAVAVDDPSALAEAAGRAVESALASLDPTVSTTLTALPSDLRFTTLLGAALQSCLDLVDSALGGIRSADSTVVGGVTIAAVLALLIRSMVSLAGAVMERNGRNRNRADDADDDSVNGRGADNDNGDIDVSGIGGLGAGRISVSTNGADGRLRIIRNGPVAANGLVASGVGGLGMLDESSSAGVATAAVVGVTSFEAAAALNNDPRAILVDIRSPLEASTEGVPDLRPFRRGVGAPYASLPFTPTSATSPLIVQPPQPPANAPLLATRTRPLAAAADGESSPTVAAAFTSMATAAAAALQRIVTGSGSSNSNENGNGGVGVTSSSAAAEGAQQNQGSTGGSNRGADAFVSRFRNLASRELVGAGGGAATAGKEGRQQRADGLVLPGAEGRVLLIDTYGTQAAEAVRLLQSDPELRQRLGPKIQQGVISFVEGGFAGPEGWKASGLPVMIPDPEFLLAASAAAVDAESGSGSRSKSPFQQQQQQQQQQPKEEQQPQQQEPLPQQQQGQRDSSSSFGLLGGLGGASVGAGVEASLGAVLGALDELRRRYPSLFPRLFAVGAAGGAGVALATSVDWAAVTRGSVELAAALLLADRALPTGVRPSGWLRKYLEAQLSAPLPITSATSDADADPSKAAAAAAASRRRRTALLLRALDLAEAVGDAVVRAGVAATTAAGGAAKEAIAAAAAANAAASGGGGGAVTASAGDGASRQAQQQQQQHVRQQQSVRQREPDTQDLVAALAAAGAMSGVTLLPGLPAVQFPKASAGLRPTSPSSPPPTAASASHAGSAGAATANANTVDSRAQESTTTTSETHQQRRRQPVRRTSSPERAAAAAAALQRLRAEMGLTPSSDSGSNSSGGTGSGDGSSAVPLPAAEASADLRNWRTELEAAATSAAMTSAATAVAEATATATAGGAVTAGTRRADVTSNGSNGKTGGGGGGRISGGRRRAEPVTAASASGRASAAAASRRTSSTSSAWREVQRGEGRDDAVGFVRHDNAGGDVGGSLRQDDADDGSAVRVSAVPSDWRARIEGSGHSQLLGGSSSGGGGSSGGPVLSAAERAARDARLRDWRVLV